MCAFVTGVSRERDTRNTPRPGEARADPGPMAQPGSCPGRKERRGRKEGTVLGLGPAAILPQNPAAVEQRRSRPQQQAQEPLRPGPLTGPPRARWANGQPGRPRGLR